MDPTEKGQPPVMLRWRPTRRAAAPPVSAGALRRSLEGSSLVKGSRAGGPWSSYFFPNRYYTDWGPRGPRVFFLFVGENGLRVGVWVSLSNPKRCSAICGTRSLNEKRQELDVGQ